MWSLALSDTCFDEEDAHVLSNVLESGWVSMGALTEKFERRFADFINVKHAIAVSNGTAALHLACESLNIGAGDEVIVPSLTFVATANAVLYAGATPVFADIQGARDLTIAPEAIENCISPRTKAIVVVHYAGYPCNMTAIMAIARRHNLHVIEDSAHAPGATHGTLNCGAIGDIGCFSFFANKNMTTAEGGMLTTNRTDLAQRIRCLRSHGMTSSTYDRHRGHAYSYDVTALGYNYRIDELRSALGLRQLGKLAQWNAQRRALWSYYRDALDDIDALAIPFRDHEGQGVHHIFPILLKHADCRPQFMSALKSHGIQTSIHYPPVHLFSYYRRTFGFRAGMLPNTEMAASREVTLPLYPGMEIEDIDRIRACIKKFFRNKRAVQPAMTGSVAGTLGTKGL